MTNDVIKACDELWSSRINKVCIDFLSKKIEFELLTIDNGVQTNHTFVIESYSNVNIMDFSHSMLNCDYYEITSIYLKQSDLKDGILNDSDLLIEVWDCKIMFNAPSVVIDGTQYIL